MNDLKSLYFAKYTVHSYFITNFEPIFQASIWVYLFLLFLWALPFTINKIAEKNSQKLRNEEVRKY